MLNITNVLNTSYSFYIIIYLCMKCSQTKSQLFHFFLGLIKKKKNCVAISILSDSLHMESVYLFRRN